MPTKTRLLSILVLETPSLINYPLENIAAVSRCKTEQQVLRTLAKGKYDAIVCGLERGRFRHEQFLSQLQASYPDVAFIIAIFRETHVRAALLAMISGASGFVVLSPFSENRVTFQLKQAIQRNHLNQVVNPSLRSTAGAQKSRRLEK
jgi:DNA-binding NtrC family response regulator